MGRKNNIIAIDGYSSCGKSTLAKALAKRLHYLYIDSGAMYRAVTVYFLRNAVSLDDEQAVRQALANIRIDFHATPEKTSIFLNGEDISDEIRQMHISDNVSEVSAIKAVRQSMVALQQELGRSRNIVMDGRDIGTTVFPDANVKIFMTADPNVRAQRRYLELKNKGEQITLEEVFENLAHRDYIDTTREESPLVRTHDAVILDNTELNEEQQLQFVLDRLP
ncbi:(d)CMP kinase [Parapedobacter lycopersici]|uniref:(d)CMP kinase n=1 Tax=Parapedobacter lycopersici TaxID=1864939 RepID=UPI003340BEC5